MKPYGQTYYKAPVVIVDYQSEPPKRRKRLLGPSLITIGSIMVANVIWPIVSHQLISSPRLQKQESYNFV